MIDKRETYFVNKFKEYFSLKYNQIKNKNIGFLSFLSYCFKLYIYIYIYIYIFTFTKHTNINIVE